MVKSFLYALVAGLAVLLASDSITPACAGVIMTADQTAEPTQFGWAGVWGDGDDDDVATFLLWGFGIALLWPNGQHGQWTPPTPGKEDPPIPPFPPIVIIDPSDGDVPEVGTLALVGLGIVGLIVWRKRGGKKI